MQRFGSWHTIYMRGRRWIDKGVLDRVFAELQRVELEAQFDQAARHRAGWKWILQPKAYRRKPWVLNHTAYRARNAIERYFARLPQ